MKRKARRLALSSETVRVLRSYELPVARGGSETDISGHFCSFVYSCVAECSKGAPVTTCN